jgi:hypothetical protein
MNENQIADIWMLFKEYIDRKIINNVAERYIELLSDHGVTDKQLEATFGHDDTLDYALSYFFNGDEEEYDENSDDWDD